VIRRLRPAHTPQRLAEIYAQPHDHRQWLDHHLRVDVTIALAKWLARGGIRSAADLSCGNAAIIDALDVHHRYRGDLAPGYPITGPLEDTIEQIPHVDMYICSETLEHVDDPATVLKQIRTKTSLLVLSTPVEAWDDPNEEHYHAWDRAGVEELLTAAGFQTAAYSTVDFRHVNPLFYCFGIFGCV
jgi:hypothetical protein